MANINSKQIARNEDAKVMIGRLRDKKLSNAEIAAAMNLSHSMITAFIDDRCNVTEGAYNKLKAFYDGYTGKTGLGELARFNRKEQQYYCYYVQTFPRSYTNEQMIAEIRRKYQSAVEIKIYTMTESYKLSLDSDELFTKVTFKIYFRPGDIMR